MTTALLLLLAAGEVVRLGPENWDRVPHGKEVDAIYGDFLMRNDKVVAVLGNAVPGRKAHMNCGAVQGAVLDFTTLEAQNDQLTAFMPHGYPHPKPAATSAEIVRGEGPEVVLRFTRPATGENPVESVTEYALRDGESFLRVTTRHKNASREAARARLSDKMRCDQTFTITPEGAHDSIDFYDRWFHAAYAVVREGGKIYSDGKFGGMGGPTGGTWLDYPDLMTDPATQMTDLRPGQEVVLTRYLLTGRHAAEVRLAARDLLRRGEPRVDLFVTGADRKPLAGVLVSLKREPKNPRDEKELPLAHTDAQGRAALPLPEGRHTLVLSQVGRPAREVQVDASGMRELTVPMGPLSQVSFTVVDEQGVPSPCKVQFLGVAGTPEPDLGPVQRAEGCKNLYFSHTGRFTTPLPAGKYYVIISRGPEYDAVYRYLLLGPDQKANVSARLVRVVNSRGWVSADFHNHSTESGDNTTVLDSRILCLVAEGLDFAACTEHNRIYTYRQRLKALGLEKTIATSDGIELTNNPGALNHQNAFPLRWRPFTQDGGGPQTHADPRVQIKRLSDHDSGAEKLMQQNHPDIGYLFFDKDGDGSPDEGFGTVEFTHVMEVWASNILAMRPFSERTMRDGKRVMINNRVFNWLQLLNLGIRVPGVANSDAHTCFHESGSIRNYVKCSTDNPALIDEMEIVRESKKGRIVMTNGPFLDVSFEGALPGDEIRLQGGRGKLKVRVETANWLNIDRVQVLVNGRPDPKLNFTRETHPAAFGEGPVRFQGEIEVELAKDAHLIVVAAGLKYTIGPVMGQRSDPPVAISNPIWVDVDGGGVSPSKDTLDHPLPTRKTPD